MNRNGRCSMEIPDFSLVEHKSWTSLWPDDSRAIVQQSLDTATNGGSGHFTAFCPTFAGTPKWWDVIVTALYHDDGSLNYLLSVSRDITALRESNAALHESRERLHNIITQAATGVVETDSDGRITLANARFCAMLGRTEAGLLGLRVGDISAPEFVEPSRSAIEALRNGGPPVVIEKQYLRHDGSRLWATTSVNALRAADGAFEGMVAVIVDITDRKAAEEKLRDADQRKDEFLAMLAHELRNPLAPIGSAAQYLSSAPAPSSSARCAT